MNFDHFPDLRQLRAFQAIARQGSFVAASEVLHVSQPAVTYLARQLEEELDTQLFDRNSRGTGLTANGKLFAVRTERLFQQMFAAIAHLNMSARGPRNPQAVMARLTKLQCCTLLALWDYGNLRTAAQHLGVREQAVARTLRSLEQLCQTGFFENNVMRSGLLEHAKEFARRIALAGMEIEAVLQEFESHARVDIRSLRVGALVLAPRLLLAECIEACARMSPAQSVEIVEGSYEDLVVLLRAGKIDLIFGALRDPPPFDDLAEDPLLHDPYVLACRRNHPLRQVEHLTGKHMRHAQFIMPTAGLRRDVMLKLFDQLGIAPSHQTHTNWLPSIIALLRVSDRLTILSRWHLEEDGGDELYPLDVAVPYSGRHVGITTRRDWLPTTLQSQFIQEVRSAAATRRERHAQANDTGSSITRPGKTGGPIRQSSAPESGQRDFYPRSSN